jgi:hypothetical protein
MGTVGGGRGRRSLLVPVPIISLIFLQLSSIVMTFSVFRAAMTYALFLAVDVNAAQKCNPSGRVCMAF